jgi:hypothetical protein
MCLRVEAISRARVALLSALALAPYLGLGLFEWGQRLVYSPEATLELPWQARRAPYAPLADRVNPEGWGDLIRMARLPQVSALLAAGPSRARRVTTDADGFMNRPAAEAADERGYPILVAGASFEVAGSDVDATFPSQLERASGRRTYNAAWPAVGPVHAVLELLEDPKLGAPSGQLLVWGIIQRSLEESQFRDVFRRIAPDGRLLPASAGARARATLRRWRSFHERLEQHLQETSLARRSSDRLARFLPPVALDLGAGSPVRVGWLDGDRARPMLFFADEMRSARRGFEARGGERIAGAIERVDRACRARGVRLLVVLVPDKYQVFRGRVRMELALAADARGGFADRRAPELLAERLRAHNIVALDLYPALSRDAEGELLYRPDDTHWSDAGIREAAEYVAAQLPGASSDDSISQ